MGTVEYWQILTMDQEVGGSSPPSCTKDVDHVGAGPDKPL
jgi:hypothetical protein